MEAAADIEAKVDSCIFNVTGVGRNKQKETRISSGGSEPKNRSRTGQSAEFLSGPLRPGSSRHHNFWPPKQFPFRKEFIPACEAHGCGHARFACGDSTG